MLITYWIKDKLAQHFLLQKTRLYQSSISLTVSNDFTKQYLEMTYMERKKSESRRFPKRWDCKYVRVGRANDSHRRIYFYPAYRINKITFLSCVNYCDWWAPGNINMWTHQDALWHSWQLSSYWSKISPINTPVRNPIIILNLSGWKHTMDPESAVNSNWLCFGGCCPLSKIPYIKYIYPVK